MSTKPTLMMLCEQNHVVLKPYQTYRFVPDKNCKECVKIALDYAKDIPAIAARLKRAGIIKD